MRYVKVSHNDKETIFYHHDKFDFFIARLSLVFLCTLAVLFICYKDFLEGISCVLIACLFIEQVSSYKRENAIIELIGDLIEMAKKQNKEGGEE